MTKKPIIIKSITQLNKKKSVDSSDDALDQWVNKESDDAEKKIATIDAKNTTEETRFTIMMPTYLHRRVKKYCASRSISMKTKLIEIFKENFPET